MKAITARGLAEVIIYKAWFSIRRSLMRFIYFTILGAALEVVDFFFGFLFLGAEISDVSAVFFGF